jgi:hypothetical protein
MYDYALIKDANERKILPYNTGEGFGSLKSLPDSVKSLNQAVRPVGLLPKSFRGQGLA